MIGKFILFMSCYYYSSNGTEWPAQWLKYEIDDEQRGRRRISAEEWLVLADMENANDQLRHIDTSPSGVLAMFSSALRSSQCWKTVAPPTTSSKKGKKAEPDQVPERQLQIEALRTLTVLCFILYSIF